MFKLSKQSLLLRGLKAALPLIRNQVYAYTTIQHQSQPSEQKHSTLTEYNLIEYDPSRIVVTGYTDKAFQLGPLRLFGSIMLFPRNFFYWNVQLPEQITINSLRLIEFMNPTPEVLIVGTGESYYRLPTDLRAHFKQNGIAIEEMRTVAAISTFNILNQENRNVACAVLSISPLDVTKLTPADNPSLFMEIQEAMSFHGKDYGPKVTRNLQNKPYFN